MQRVTSAFLILASPAIAALNAADFPTFRDCVVEAMVRNETMINLPRKVNSAYLVDQPLPAWPGGRLTVRGEGGSILYLRGKGQISMAGCVLRLVDLIVHGDPQNPPEVGVCFRRAEEGPYKAHSINGCGLDNVTVQGAYTKVAVLVLCAEGDTIFRSRINNTHGDALVYDSNDRYQLGYITDTGSYTNTGHNLIATEVACWNATEKDLFPLKICGFTDSLVAQGIYLTAQGCRAYVAVESYPASHNRGNIPRWNTLETCGFETRADKAPKYGVLYRRLASQPAYPEPLKKLPSIRWQTGPATGQETVP